MKNRGAGFFLTWFTVLMAIGSVVFYLFNCRTHYFASFGIDWKIVFLPVAGIILQFIQFACSTGKFRIAGDMIAIVLPAIYAAALIAFLSARITEIAFIFTFENNAANMADLQSAIAGIAFCVLAVVGSLVAAWFDIRKDVAE